MNGAVHNNGSNYAFLDGHAKWQSLGTMTGVFADYYQQSYWFWR